MYLQLLHYSQKDSLPVSLLHIELTGATLGATKINESEIPLSLHSLSPTRGEGGDVSRTFVSSTPPAPATSSSNSVFGAHQSSSTSAFDMSSLAAGLATVTTVSRNQVNLEGRVSRLEGKVEQWEEVLNKIKHFDFDTHPYEQEIEFELIGTRAILSTLNQRIELCGESTTYLRSRLSGLEESMKIIGDKNVELQGNINSLKNAAECGGANFESSLVELKNMQENFYRQQTEMKTRFEQGLTQSGSEHGE